MTTNSSSSDVMEMWRRADAVCFDVDSTLCTHEGLDELARFAGVYDEISAWTSKAMSGSVTFQDALAARLKILKGSKELVEKFLSESTALALTPHVKDLVERLQSRGVTVYLVSGGFHDLIDPLAKELHIPLDNVYANNFSYDHSGVIVGFDTEQLTSRSGGKTRVAELLKQRHKTVVFVGDGVTDMEASPPADAFIGFGGNVKRKAVMEKCKWFVTSMTELLEALD